MELTLHTLLPNASAPFFSEFSSLVLVSFFLTYFDGDSDQGDNDDDGVRERELKLKLNLSETFYFYFPSSIVFPLLFN